MKRLLSGLLLLLVIGCGSKTQPLKERVVGTWKPVGANGSSALILKPDGTGTVSSPPANIALTWKVLDETHLDLRLSLGSNTPAPPPLEITFEGEQMVQKSTQTGEVSRYERVTN